MEFQEILEIKAIITTQEYYFISFRKKCNSIFVLGQYLYLEATGYAPGTEFRFQSPVLPAGQAFSLRFWYHMYGKGMGSLSVYEILGENSDIGKMLWRMTGGDRSSKTN